MSNAPTGAQKEQARSFAEEVLELPWHDLVAELADPRVERPARTKTHEDLELELARAVPQSQRSYTRADLERYVSNPANPLHHDLEPFLPDGWGHQRPSRAEVEEADRKIAALNNPRRGKVRYRRKERGRSIAHRLIAADPELGVLADKLLRKEVAQLTKRRR